MKRIPYIIASLLFICLALVLYSVLFMNNAESNKSKIVEPKIIEELIEREDLDLAKNYVDSIYQENPKNINVLISRADFYLQISEPKISIECLSSCLNIEPKNNVCAEKLMEIHCAIFDKTDGVINKSGNSCKESIDYLLDFDSKNVTALYEKAKLSFYQGENDLAERISMEILEIDSNNLGALKVLTLIYTTDQNNKLAEKYHNKVLEQEPNSANYYTYGKYFQDLGNYESAIEKYRISISLDNKYFESYYSLGFCLLVLAESEKDALRKRDLLKEALQNFEKTVSLTSDSFKELYALYSQGRCYKNMGNYKAAIEKYKFCLMIEPGFEPAINGMLELEKK